MTEQNANPANTATPAAANNAAAATPAADPAKASATPEPKKEEQQLLFDIDDTKEKAVDPNAEKKDDEKPKDGEKKDDAPAYLKLDDIAVPEDMPIPDEVKAELSSVFEKHKVTGDEQKALMQDLVNMHVKMMNDQVESFNKMKVEWRKEVETDPQIGGANLETSKKAANAIVRQFAGNPEFGGSPELLKEFSDDLILLGLGNKKSFIRVMLNMHKATQNGSLLGKSGTDGQQKKDTASVLWPNMAQ